MHPNRAFDWTDEGAMLDFVARQAFATIALPAPGVVHAPVIVGGRSILFHVARHNRMAERIDGQSVVISIIGRHGYQSANWYASDDQVPTWHYEAVEIDGVARMLDHAGLARQVETLVATMEERFQPAHPWTIEKMAPGRFEAMLRGIVGFEVPIAAIRGTRKFNQHKSAEDMDATLAGLRSADLHEVAEAVEELRS